MPTLLFDEIDTGVSGEIALKVGRVMKKLSQKNQVIAITHLPQIASREGTHFLVYKEIQKGTTRTQMEELSPELRIQEIAKMLSGNNPGEFALKNARELMENV
jgi:DNA repair protein RecN (Recombination protein N)